VNLRFDLSFEGNPRKRVLALSQADSVGLLNRKPELTEPVGNSVSTTAEPWWEKEELNGGGLHKLEPKELATRLGISSLTLSGDHEL
jgi:hypothetical protein